LQVGLFIGLFLTFLGTISFLLTPGSIEKNTFFGLYSVLNAENNEFVYVFKKIKIIYFFEKFYILNSKIQNFPHLKPGICTQNKGKKTVFFSINPGIKGKILAPKKV
jgi:hypothetical protein